MWTYIFRTLFYRLLILLGNPICTCKSLHKFKHNTKPTKFILCLSAHKGLQLSGTVFNNKCLVKKKKVFRKQVLQNIRLSTQGLRCTGSGLVKPVFKPIYKNAEFNRYLSFIFKISTKRDKTRPSPVYFHYHWFALHLFNTTHSIGSLIRTLEMCANICAISMYLLFTNFFLLLIKGKKWKEQLAATLLWKGSG